MIQLCYSTDTSTSKAKVQFEAALNCTKFAKQFLSLSNNNLDISPYVIGLRVGYKKNWLRLGAGVDYSHNSSTGNGFSNTVSLNNQDFRIGYQREVPLSKYFSSFLGADILTSNFQNKTVSNSDIFNSENKDDLTGFGLGFNIGIQWNISKRIAFYTEAGIQSISKSGSSVNRTWGGGSDFENKTNLTETSIKYIAPTSIFFHFKF